MMSCCASQNLLVGVSAPAVSWRWIQPLRGNRKEATMDGNLGMSYSCRIGKSYGSPPGVL